MTCICAIQDPKTKKVYMGGDSAGVAGLHISVREDVKVFTNGPFVMGGTSSFRMIQLLHHQFVPPKQGKQSDMEFMVNDFVSEAQRTFMAGGFTNDKKTGGTFLVGYKGKLYMIDTDFQVGVVKDGFYAVGCGADLALGSLYSTKGKKPIDRIKMALSASVHFNGGVRPPFTIVSKS